MCLSYLYRIYMWVQLLMFIHRIHNYGGCAVGAWSEFSAAWNRGILGRVEYIFCPVRKRVVLVLDSRFTHAAAFFYEFGEKSNGS